MSGATLLPGRIARAWALLLWGRAAELVLVPWRGGGPAASGPLLAGLDALAAWLPGRFAHRPPPGAAEPFGAALMAAHADAVLGHHALRPAYEEGPLNWLLAQLAEKRLSGTLECAAVRDARGELAGWFLYFLNPGGVSQVVQLAARPAAQALVLQHLFHHAWQRGAAAVAGRLEPALLDELGARGCAFVR